MCRLSSVQLLSHVRLFMTPWTAACQAFVSITITHWTVSVHPIGHWSWSLELAQTHVHWVGDAIQSSHSLSSPSPPAFNLSQHQSVLCIRWPKYWSFSISPSNEYSGLISFRIDWSDLLAVQGTKESSLTPQFKSISSSALSFLYSATLTSIHDYWKNYSFD